MVAMVCLTLYLCVRDFNRMLLGKSAIEKGITSVIKK